MSEIAARDRIIAALDAPALAAAARLVEDLRDAVGGFKVGLAALTAGHGRDLIALIRSIGHRVLYDAKFSDIPNTMGDAVRAAADLGVWGLTVHASCGPRGLAAAVAARGDTKVFAVTVLTSLDPDACRAIYGIPPELAVRDFARMALAAGADGVVCAPGELATLRADPALRALRTVVPGVRPVWAAPDDQARFSTPAQAIRAGADYLVIGRPLTRPPWEIGGPADAAARIVAEIEDVIR